MKKKRVMFLILGILIFMTLGTVYSWSVFKKPLEELLGLSATESGLPYMVFLVSYAITMPFAGSFIDKLGPRLIITIGGILVGIGWFLAGFASTGFHLVISYGLIAGAGVGVVYGVPIAVSAKWFPDKKGLAVGITLAGFGLSPFITAPLASAFIAKFGVMATFKILGIAFLIINTILAIPFVFPTEEYTKKFKTNSKKSNINFTLKEMVKHKNFHGLFLSYTIGTFVGLMCIGISSPFAQEVVGLDKAKASLFVSFFAIFNGLGRPLFGSLTDKLGISKSSILSYTLIIIASILGYFSKSGNIVLFAIAFSLFWLNLGGWLAIGPTATARLFGDKNYSQNYGVVFLAYGLGAILGTLVSGYVRDAYGSYLFIFLPISVLAFIGIIVNQFVIKNK